MTVASAVWGKRKAPEGKTPAIALVNPKYPHNVGAAVRAASCFGAKQVWWTGERVRLDTKKRLPREERMKGYQDVEMVHFDHVFEQFPRVTPVAIELRPGSETLPLFEHPDNALYVFGPEDGSIPSVVLQHCHRFVVIPTRHCINLAAAVYLVLYDRLVKTTPALTITEALNEYRHGFAPDDDFHQDLGLQ
jgi:tRNA(Leu) C34 or U34 (ribose-2'-O)-methylase TrmL